MACGLLAASAVQAAKTNYVSELGTNDIPPFVSWELATSNLQAAINDTITNDTVLVTNGTYWINAEITITNAITVKSVAGAAGTAVIRSTVGTNAPQHRIFHVTANATLDGFTVKNGYLPKNGLGAGIKITAGTVQNCLIWTNGIANDWNSFGGGIHLSGSSKLQFSTVVSNFTGDWGQGGGVYAAGAATVISNRIAFNFTHGLALNNSPSARFCTIEYNTGSTGGGLYTYGGTATNCLIRFNNASSGAGVYGVNGNTVLDCTIVSNTATSLGGGVFISSAYSPLLFRGCVISGNTNAHTGGIYFASINPDDGTRTFELCRITDNFGQRAVYISGVSLPIRFRNCTISAPQKVGVEVGVVATNRAGIWSPIFTNTIVYGFATNIYSTNATVLSAVLTNSFSYSCSPQLTEPGYNNVSADPAFVAPVSWNYRLKRYSPCARTGSTNVFSLFKSDIEGVPFGKTVNMGCYETLTPYAGGTVVTVR